MTQKREVLAQLAANKRSLAIRVFCLFYGMADQDGRVSMSISEIAEVLGISRSTAYCGLKKLITLGLVEQEVEQLTLGKHRPKSIT